jgi:hypothetical protein
MNAAASSARTECLEALGTFNMAWDNIVKGGYLKLREKGQREGRYSL